MSAEPLAAVVLAAGKGRRMASPLPKVLIPVAGQPMLGRVLATLREVGVQRSVVVEGPSSPRPSESYVGGDVTFVVQGERLGTAHALRQAEAVLSDHRGAILVVNGDMPLVREGSMRSLVRERAARGLFGALLVARDEAATLPGLGRVFLDDDGCVEAMVEARDLAARPELDRGGPALVNVGAYLFGGPEIWDALRGVGDDNSQGEYYLTDVVAVLRSRGHRCAAVEAEDVSEAMGVNTPEDLARVESELLRRAQPEVR